MIFVGMKMVKNYVKVCNLVVCFINVKLMLSLL